MRSIEKTLRLFGERVKSWWAESFGGKSEEVTRTQLQA